MNNAVPIPKHHLIGHRGAAGLRPENTLCSFSYAAELGLNWIEFDVHLTKDNHWIVIHDDTLDRTTNGHGPVTEHTADELIELDAGLWFNPPYPEQTLPTLMDTLHLAAELNLFCNVEIKGADSNPQLNAQQFATFVRKNNDVVDNQILVSSFNLEVLVELRKLLPDLPLAYIKDEFTEDMITLAQQHNFASINCLAKRFTTTYMQAAQRANIPVFLYTVNDMTTANYWIDKGVTGLFTDRPDLLLPA
ncbi:MAG TPA: glycerophosphodiester phosphodiesterase family protein [Gammaproteobacteria bacterium]|nr:glycerophosphodiester phosphodiesterase family protein [Gammaproteobacteria bacterium]